MASSAALTAPGLPDRERPHRNPARHLDRREQGIEPFERLAFHRHSENGNQRVRGEHARQVRRSARGGDDHFNAVLFRIRSVFGGQGGAAMSRHHPRFVRDAEFGKRLRSGLHHVPIGLAAHHDSD